jgi:hypothetical protein
MRAQLVVTGQQLSQYGDVTQDANGTWVYTPNPNRGDPNKNPYRNKSPFPIQVGKLIVREDGYSFINANGQPEIHTFRDFLTKFYIVSQTNQVTVKFNLLGLIRTGQWDPTTQPVPYQAARPAVGQQGQWDNCQPLLGVSFAFGMVNDRGSSLGFLGGPLQNLTGYVAADPKTSGGFIFVSPSEKRFDGLKGTGTTDASGNTTYTFTDTRTVGSQDGTVVTLKFTVPVAPAGAAPLPPTNVDASFLAPADKTVGSTEWSTTTGTAVGFNNAPSTVSQAASGTPRSAGVATSHNIVQVSIVSNDLAPGGSQAEATHPAAAQARNEFAASSRGKGSRSKEGPPAPPMYLNPSTYFNDDIVDQPFSPVTIFSDETVDVLLQPF